MDEDFFNQFKGSASANIATLLVAGVLYILKRLVDRPSKCKEVKSDCCCCSLDIINQTQRNDISSSISFEDVKDVSKV